MHPHHESAISGGHGPVMVLLLAIQLLLLGLYLLAAVAVRNRMRAWNPWRTAAFVAGAAMVITALLPPVANFAHQDLRMHMVQHLLLGMFGPIGLVLGAPVTLALRTLPTQASRRLTAILRSRPVHGLAHPLTALVLNIGGMALLYTTPLFGAMLDSAAIHFVVHVHFLAAGCLFTWAIVGIDPGRARKSHAYRLFVLFLAIGFHAMLSKAMYAYGWPRETPYSIHQVEQAAQIMYYGGDLSELLLAVALFASWPIAAAGHDRAHAAR